MWSGLKTGLQHTTAELFGLLDGQAVSSWIFLFHVTQSIQNVWKCLAVLLCGAGNEPEKSRAAYKQVSESTNDLQQLAHKAGEISSQANTFLAFHYDLICTGNSPLTNLLLNVCADNKANVWAVTVCRSCWFLPLLIFHWKCFLFWLWGHIWKTQFYACCQTEALMMRSFPDQSHWTRWHIRGTSELTEIYLGVLMCPDVEFSFSCCYLLRSEVTSALWPLWGEVFLLLGSGNCLGRYQGRSNAMRRHELPCASVRESCDPCYPLSPCSLQAATVPLTPRQGPEPRQEGSGVKTEWFFQDLSRKSAPSWSN